MVAETHAAAHAAPAHADGHGGHSLLHHHFDDMAQQRECHSLGMWLFLATEVMMFGGLFFAYTLYRMIYPGAFHAGSHHLNHDLGTANTFVLLFSSLTMAMAVHAAAERNKRALLWYLAITVFLGLAFLGIKAVEWGTDFKEGLVPGVRWTYYLEHPDEIHELTKLHVGTQHVQLYFVVYFCMTGLHALHMIVGITLLLVFMALGAKGAFTNGNDQPVEIVGLYWHLVDIIWVFLFPLLYLIGPLHLHMLGGQH